MFQSTKVFKVSKSDRSIRIITEEEKLDIGWSSFSSIVKGLEEVVKCIPNVNSAPTILQEIL
jgi:hypothetical protein